MKRIVSIVIAMVMVFFLVGCSTRKETEAMIEKTEALEQEIAELKEQIEQLAGYSNITSEQLEQQKELNELLTKKLDNLMGVPIVYTDVEPFIDNNYVYNNKELYVEFTNFHAFRPYNAFEEFYIYYINEFSDKIDGEFYFLDPHDSVNGSVMEKADSINYSIYVDEIDEEGVLVNPILEQYMCVRDEVLGGEPLNREGFDLVYSNVSFTMYICMVPSAQKGRISELEFGLKEISKGVGFINLIANGTYVGTAYYNNRVYISYTWFLNYFRGKLTADLYYGAKDISERKYEN